MMNRYEVFLMLNMKFTLKKGFFCIFTLARSQEIY